MTPKRKRLVVLSDLHAGHEFGLCPPAWWAQADKPGSRRAKAGRFQRQLWSFYTRAIDALKPIDILVVNGDAIDGKGDRSGGVELITSDRLEQVKMAAEAINYAEAEAIRITYGCLTAGHKILKADLTWAPVESLNVGDELLAFDESADHKGNRRYRRSIVEANAPFEDEVYDLVLSDGSKITANKEHPFLMRRGGRRYEWVTVGHLFKIAHPTTPGFGTNGLSDYMPMPFPRILPVWETLDAYEAGYLSGFYDGEGCVNQPVKRRGRGAKFSNEHGLKVSATQKQNAALEYAEHCLRRLGFITSTLRSGDRDTRNVAILGGTGEQLRFLGSVRPKRLLKNFSVEKLMAVRGQGKGNELYVTDILPAGRQVVYGLQTSSRTYISDGFLSHNTRYHTGRDEDFEEALKALVKGHAAIHGHDFLDINGCKLDIKHKVGGSTIPHGRMTAIARARLWNVVWHSEHERQPKADILIRSHVHYFGYCGGASWLGMTTPALTYNSAYGIRDCEGLVDVGLIVFDFAEDGSYSWRPILAGFDKLTVKAERI
jgi:hypothetical protein